MDLWFLDNESYISWITDTDVAVMKYELKWIGEVTHG